ncbi:N-acetylmuramic acid 6-phosphate etherase [Parapedobacter pyrenivorans]|uniref:N-acetylmuramic acid 6-phosphate etherase n=1 Tax=Parapedobacter pyrenivorans TaxID=1305674 RepID=A0A917HBW9_9SPHI|nr:N-acetylmuramic acid 6-phosphate etherase [Parapedobacter pyrenivorans]GGG73916.1 N-acetylmuramic acid 6-phosphate etherase [Parapedobacter pyrenivorans]
MNIRVTESPSHYRNLEQQDIDTLISWINQEDQKVALKIKEALPQLSKLIGVIVEKLKTGGRLFYVGAGSGGRLSVLDVIELPNTFGIPKGKVNVILAGGVEHLVEAKEEREDDTKEGWANLREAGISPADVVVGIAASGTTPFVLEALKACRNHGITTGCIVSNPESPIAEQADYPVEVVTGPEFITGSTRMKSGSAQKMIFDMISTTTMICLGRVEDNSMVNMALINDKAVDRAVRMLVDKSNIADYGEAKRILLQNGSVRKALDALASSETSSVDFTPEL